MSALPVGTRGKAPPRSFVAPTVRAFTRVADPPGGFPWWIVVLIVVVLLGVAIGYIAWRRRSRRTDPPGSPMPPAPAVPAAPV